MTLSICVPWRPDGAERSRAWEWVRARYERLVPEAEIIMADSDGERFSLAQAANRAVKESSGDVVFVASAEIACDADYLRRAVKRAKKHLVVPAEYHYLTQTDSAALLEQDPSIDIATPSTTEWSGAGMGHFMLPRAAFDAVGGYDERHKGWGWEDLCLVAAVETLWAPLVRIPGRAFHFWHPRSDETTWKHATAPEQVALTHRYHAAAGDPAAMRALIGGR